MSAERYNGDRISQGLITPHHIELLARSFQDHTGLLVDGQIGPKTIAALEARYPQPKLTHAVMRPLGMARPLITSGHWLVNPSRKPTPSYHGHQGVDIMYRLADLSPEDRVRAKSLRVYNDGKFAVPPNTACYACFSGAVIDVVDRANGWAVTLEAANGMVAVYRHLQTVALKRGDVAMGGDTVGIVGHTTETSLVHLHFELHASQYALQHNYRASINPGPHLVWETT